MNKNKEDENNKNSNKIKNAFYIISLIVLAFLLCMQCTSNIFQSERLAINTDSNVFKYIALNMKNGLVPYLDMFDHKGLLLYFINYIGILISPTKGVWIIEFIFMFVSVWMAFKLATKFTSKFNALIVTIIVFSLMSIYFEGGNLTEEYALPFQLIALNIFFDFFINKNKYLNIESSSTKKLRLNYKYFNFGVFICGLCFSCVLFLRANMISIWIVFIIMILIYCIAHKHYLEILKFIISFLLGMLVVSLPMVFYLIKNNALRSFIDCYIIFNMHYSNTASKLQKMECLLYFFNNSIIFLSFIIVIIKIFSKVKKKENCYLDCGYLIYMILTLILVSMSGNCYNHYAMTMIPAMIYPYSVLFKYINETERKKIGINLIVSSYLVYTIVIPFMIPLVKNSLNEIFSEEQSVSTNEIIDYINKNTTENDLISVFGNSDYIYNYTNRKSASRYSYQTPIIYSDPKIMEEYLLDLKNNRPKVIINYFDSSDTSEYVQRMRVFLEDNNYVATQPGIYQLTFN